MIRVWDIPSYLANVGSLFGAIRHNDWSRPDTKGHQPPDQANTPEQEITSITHNGI